MTPARFQTEYLSQAATFYRVAFYILEDAAEAEDAVQELFLRLWNGRDALDGIRNPAGYGIRVLRNLCLDRIRRSRKMETPAVLPEPDEEMLTAVTLNAAAAIGLAEKVGSVEPGKQADLVLWNAPDLDYLGYRMGSNLVNTVIKNGNIAHH